jgi:hypothetical protein
MNHDRLRQLLPAHLEDELAGRKRRAVERHIDVCDECRRELFELRRTVYLLRSLDAELPPEGLADRVLAAVAEAGAPGPLERLRSGIGRFLEGPFGAPLLMASVGAIAVVVFSGAGGELVLAGAPEPTSSFAAVAAREPAAAPRSSRSATRAAPRPAPMVGPRRQLAGGSSAAPRRLPLPAACLQRPNRPECLPWHSFLVGLAMHDTPAFLAEVDAVPGASRERWLQELSRYAGPSSSALVAAQLRAAPDPRAARVASSFERIAAGPRR